MAITELREISWERMVRAVEKVKERLLRAAAALERAKIPYAVIGGNAVAAWVSRVDESAVRNTRDVDVLLRRTDLARATAALTEAGFVHRHVAQLDIFLDGPTSSVREALHIIFAGEKVRPDYAEPAPDVLQSERAGSFQVVTLEALVRMKLTSFRAKDQTHLYDMLEVGLIDGTWCARLSPELARRLRHLVENPEG